MFFQDAENFLHVFTRCREVFVKFSMQDLGIFYIILYIILHIFSTYINIHIFSTIIFIKMIPACMRM